MSALAAALARPLQVHLVNPADDPNWDAKVAAFPQATFFHRACWARVLETAYGFVPAYLVTSSGENEVASVVPLLEVDSWLTGRRGVCLPFTDACDALVQPDHAPDRLWSDLRSVAGRRGWKYLELRGAQAVPAGAVPAVSFLEHNLSLGGGEERLRQQCHDSVRRALRKARAAGLRVEFTSGAAGLRHFSRLLGVTRRRHGLPVQPGRFFEAIRQHVLAPGHGDIALAWQGQRVVAAAMFFKHRTTVLYKFGASDARGQELRANHELMWSAIAAYAQQGYRDLNFGRTTADHAGLRQFKLGWGTTERPLDYFRYDLGRGEFVRAADDSRGWHTTVFRMLPVSFLRAAGAALYKHAA